MTQESRDVGDQGLHLRCDTGSLTRNWKDLIRHEGLSVKGMLYSLFLKDWRSDAGMSRRHPEGKKWGATVVRRLAEVLVRFLLESLAPFIYFSILLKRMRRNWRRLGGNYSDCSSIIEPEQIKTR